MQTADEMGSHHSNVPFADASQTAWTGALQTHLLTSGHALPCGACYVLSAQVAGGQAPYTYVWTDAALSGPGPHQVCPTQPTDYAVTVTDSTPTVVGEFASNAQVATDTVHLDCVADAGAAGEWAGCMDPTVPGDAGMATECEGHDSDDAGTITDQGFSNTFSKWSPLAEPMVAGKVYTYDYDQLLPISFGQGITVEVFGVMRSAPCEPQTKLFTITVDQTWHQSVCFTADRNYDATYARVSVVGILWNFDLGTVGTLCRGCTQ